MLKGVTFLCSAYTFLKFMVMWTLVLLADFLLEFRLEYLWPCWLFFGSVYTTFHCHGLVRTPTVSFHILCSRLDDESQATNWLFLVLQVTELYAFDWSHFVVFLFVCFVFTGHLRCFCLCCLHPGHLLFNFCSFALAVFCGEHLCIIQLYMAYRWVWIYLW